MVVIMTLYLTEIHVTQLAQSIEWYRNILNLKLTLHDEPNHYVLLEDSMNGRLALKQSIEPTTNIIIYFQVHDLDATVDTLMQQGITTSPMLQSNEGYRSITIHDPDGIAITLFQWMSIIEHHRQSIHE